MRVLWVTYAALGRTAELLDNRKTPSGSWIDASANAIVSDKTIELYILAISNNSSMIKDTESGITYKGVSGIKQTFGKKPPDIDTEIWKREIQTVNPDIIMVWGTEYSNGISVLKAADDKPVLFFIQGVIGQITEYPFGNLKISEVAKEIGLLRTLKFIHFNKNYKLQCLQKHFENIMVSNADGVIVDNEWSKAYYQAIETNTRLFDIPLPVNPIFGVDERRSICKNTIFTIDGGNPAKGLFHLIKALVIVKKTHPDVKLLIPGRIPTGKPELLKESPYYTYIKALIHKYGLENNMVFLGQLTQSEMKDNLLKCEVFVMPSSIENHSSSLREAMYLGVPCISSQVGSVTEFTQNWVNALTYRYEDESSLAYAINFLLDNQEYAIRLGENGRKSIVEKYPQNNLCDQFVKIYKEVLKNE